MRGGVSVTTVAWVKANWVEIKDKLLELITEAYDYYRHEGFTILQAALNALEAFPDDISNLTGDQICTLLKPFGAYDCPYHFEGVIIVQYGDNVWLKPSILEQALKGKKIETYS